MKPYKVRWVTPRLHKYLFVEMIADLAIHCIVQLLLSCLGHAVQIGLCGLWFSICYLSQLLYTDGI